MHLPKIALAALLLPLPAAAQDDLLAELVKTSPALAVAEEEAKAARADLWAARGSRLPQLRVEAQAGTLEETFRINGVPGELSATRDPAGATATLEQTVFASGRIGGAIGAAKAQASGAELQYNAARQDLILAGVTAIADVVLARAVLSERRDNEAVIRSRLDESTARRTAGLATRTDVRQSEARVALASAERIAAEGQLAQAEARFERVFGKAAPSTLAIPKASAPLPSDLQSAVDRALTSNPDLAASVAGRKAAEQAVRSERGALLPQVSVRGTASYAENERFGIELGEAEQFAVTLNGRWDIFRGGSGYASTRAAKRRARGADERVRDTRRIVREQTVAAWTGLITARAAAQAREAQVLAARLSAEGVAAEFSSGRRTRLDVLDADREETLAEVGLLTTRRDLAIAEFALLRAVGGL
ncbi:TolC family protein [Parvularcula sp. ZS-1/3]|uniref:TolC family protein n=1 Tax=Parvularcula mediterranea TaxID=2732508 RepID=A0A7Y3RL99_9PROT|nr:TolC family protein [Parvularcula mediterranea]NNU16153.1 TolC family protein [Parvularcula mediterranea]